MTTLNKESLTQSVLDRVRLRKPGRDRQQVLFPEFHYRPLTKRRAAGAVESLFEIVKKALEKGDHVLISGFGRFQVRFKWARKGRDPRTGQQIVLESRRIVRFHPSSRLRQRITEGTPQS
ncbi:MAG: HU family DNA-binding protein [Thermodesulfobacteriota bacterium]